MKKIWKIILGIVLALLLTATVVVIWQWDNINALYMSVAYDKTKIEEKLENNKKKLAEALEKEEILDKKVIDGFSKEDEEKIAKGEITVEEAINNLFEEPENKQEVVQESTSKQTSTSATETETQTTSEEDKLDNTPAATQTETDPAAEKQKQLMQTAVKEMYTLKAQFLQKLGELERTGKRMYIVDNGKYMSMEFKLQIAERLMPQFVAAEKECDEKVEVVLKTLYDGLKELGKDTAVVETIRKQYNEEKKLQKTQYINEYL